MDIKLSEISMTNFGFSWNFVFNSLSQSKNSEKSLPMGLGFQAFIDQKK